MLLKIIRIILLLFSLYGYSQYLYSRFKLKAELIMPMLLSFFGSAIFLGGLLNITKETAAVIFLLGVILCAVSVKRRYSPSGLITGGTVICAAALAALLAFTYGTKLMGYDNFSQWGTVVRLIVTENRFPNFEDTVIYFQSYPVGSASLIYYFAKITGIRSEWFFIWIQQVATVCSACSIFAFCRKKRPIEYLSASAAVFCILFCVLNITAGLQVDALLSCLGIAGISVCFYYRESPETALYATIPINIFLLAVKNSGVFFAVIISLFCLLRIIKCRGFKVAVSPKKIFPLLSPFVTLLLWDKHVAFSFSGGMTAKHSMSAENYSQVFSEKTPELISQITRDFLKKVFSLDNAFFIILIALLASLLIVKIFRLTVPLCGEAAVLIIGSYTAYQLGNYFMYIFSMPNYEASILASYVRYHMTIIAFSAGLLWILLNEVFQSFGLSYKCRGVKAAALSAVYAAAAACAIWFSATPHLDYFKKEVYEGSDRQILDTIAEKYTANNAPNGSYAVIWQFDKEGYRYFLSRYTFKTGKVARIESSNPDLSAAVAGYSYIVVPEHNAYVDAFLTERFGSCTEDVYSVT